MDDREDPSGDGTSDRENTVEDGMDDREDPGGDGTSDRENTVEDGTSDGESTDGMGNGDASDEEWQFSLEDIERREAEAAQQEAAEERSQEPLEAGRPSLENVMFVVLGALLALFVISRLLVG